MTADGEVKTLEPRRTLTGKFDAYCRICWNPVYVLWIDDDDDPRGRCAFGDHKKATDCPDAMNRARLWASVAKSRAAPEEPPQ